MISKNESRTYVFQNVTTMYFMKANAAGAVLFLDAVLLFFQIDARYRPQRFFDIAVRYRVFIVNVLLP